MRPTVPGRCVLMEEERRKILEMVAEGTISVDEASELLGVIEPVQTRRVVDGDRVDDDDEDDDEDDDSYGLSVDLGDLRSDLRRMGRDLKKLGKLGKLSGLRGFDIDVGFGRSIPAIPAIPSVPAVPGVPGVIRTKHKHRVRTRHGHRRRGSEAIGNNPSFDRLVEFGSLGIDPSYVKKLKEAGLTSLTWDEVTDLASMGIDADYVAEMMGLLGDDLSVDQIVELQSMGVSTSFVSELKEAGLGDPTVDQIVELASLGIQPDYVRKMREAGPSPFDNEEDMDSGDEETEDDAQRERAES
jgi:hypothetical protein